MAVAFPGFNELVGRGGRVCFSALPSSTLDTRIHDCTHVLALIILQYNNTLLHFSLGMHLLPL